VGAAVILALVCLPGGAFAQNRIALGTFGTGGARIASSQHVVGGTIGQPVAGTTGRISSGFWYFAAAGAGTGVATEETESRLPDDYRLDANYPNPFNPSTTIRYALPETAGVRLVVYNALGQRVRTLVDAVQSAGAYSVSWDGRNDSGRSVSSGLYLYRIESRAFTSMRKMLLLK
jgi:hypothetical protein